ncbi:MAG: hypothetical protein CMH50_07500 [Myxococcales bacterium]|nr:hypothetical protein [Myxococcales bacterium]
MPFDRLCHASILRSWLLGAIFQPVFVSWIVKEISCRPSFRPIDRRLRRGGTHLLLQGQAFEQLIEQWLESLVPLVPSGSLIVGIRTGGEPLARRLADRLAREGKGAELGLLDIALYRDDVGLRMKTPRVLGTEITQEIDERFVVLVDDVFYTGRTIRAALSRIADFGRPRKVLLACLARRPGRELPIVPDVVGMDLEAPPEGFKIEVSVTEGLIRSTAMTETLALMEDAD